MSSVALKLVEFCKAVQTSDDLTTGPGIHCDPHPISRYGSAGSGDLTTGRELVVTDTD